MVEKDEAKMFKALMDGMDALIHRVTWLQILVIILLGVNIVFFLAFLQSIA
jgi:hypothetical protein